MAGLKFIGILFSVLAAKDGALSCSLPIHITAGTSSVYDSTPSSYRTLASWKASRVQYRSDLINKMPGTSIDSLSYPSKLDPILEPPAVSTSADSQLLNDFLLLSLFLKPHITSTEPPPLPPNSLHYDSSPNLPSALSDPYPTFDQSQADQLLSILLSNSGPYLLSTPTTPIAAPSTTFMPVTVSQTYLDTVSSTIPEPIITSPGITAFTSVTESSGPPVVPTSVSTFEPIVVEPLQPNIESDFVSTTTIINTSLATPLQNSTI